VNIIVPVGVPTFSEALRIGTEVFHTLKKVLKSKGLNTAVGDEGGFAPNLGSNEEAIEVILEAIHAAGYKPGEDLQIALDVASSELFKDGKYYLEAEEQPEKSAAELVDLYASWADKYPLISIEDGLDENDWDGWKTLTEKLGYILRYDRYGTKTPF
jgi:enolase